jgi:nicotinamidase-related amidase
MDCLVNQPPYNQPPYNQPIFVDTPNGPIMNATHSVLPIPPFFDRDRVQAVWRVPYQERASGAKFWAKQYEIQPAANDKTRICLLLIDVQNTFCIPGFELFVGGQSGMGAVNDNIRLCEFIYRNLGAITDIIVTLDTHTATQIFHPVFWVNEAGEHPSPMTIITLADVEKGLWKVNPTIAANFDTGGYEHLQNYAYHYVQQLDKVGKYPLTIWPYHSMLGGIGHALVAAIEEVCFFHDQVRDSQTQFEMKGGNPLTENYSVLRPEVLEDRKGHSIAQKNTALIQKLLQYDAVVVAGQAKSHCVAWTVDDLLTEIQKQDSTLAQKVYLLEDCTSPVVVPGIIDFTVQSNVIFQRFTNAGMHNVKSTEAIASWPRLQLL